MYSALESQPRGQYVMISAVGSRLLLLRTVDIYRGFLFSMFLVNAALVYHQFITKLIAMQSIKDLVVNEVFIKYKVYF